MGNKTKIFEFLYKNSETSYNINQLARLVGISVGSAFKILKEFEEKGYVGAEKEKKALLYRIKLNNPAKEAYEKLEEEKNSKSKKKTKIICAISPDSNDIGFVKKLAYNGMDAALLKTSKYNEKSAMLSVNNIRKASDSIPILLDIEGKDSQAMRTWIKFALKNDIDFISVSFVRDGEDVQKINRLLGYSGLKEVIGEKIKVIVKIEEEVLGNYREIIQEAYGIMIDRNCLVSDTKYERFPVLQRLIINDCNSQGKPAIIATQMPESMVYANHPKKFEVSDIANAVLDGASCLILTNEITEGKYSIESVKTMSRIIKNVENENLANVNYQASEDFTYFIGNAVLGKEKNLKIDALLTITSGGYSARMASSKRLKCKVIAATYSKKIFRQLNLLWGVEPLLVESDLEDISNEEKKEAILKALKNGLIKKSDQIAILASVFHSKSKRANLLEVHRVDEFLEYLDKKNKIKISEAR